ncbi:kelch repeat and BTB domain-containing protein 4-like [Watersipora subatra]|uniref:kelch repeat and BTB domain-containing protein 4-like n=1 Tax=Watersipora subatra TaxID=2589382 RepID=UPI00355B0AD9
MPQRKRTRASLKIITSSEPKCRKYSEKSEETDAVLIVKNVEFHISKLLLSVVSPVFKAIFNSKIKESETPIATLRGEEVEDIEMLLDYICHDKDFDLNVFQALSNRKMKKAKTSTATLEGKEVEDIEMLLDYIYHDQDFDLNDQNAMKLIPLAEEYQIPRLKRECVRVLLQSNTPNIDVVFLAELYNIPDLVTSSTKLCAELPTSEIEEHFEAHPDRHISSLSLLQIYTAKIDKVKNRHVSHGLCQAHIRCL